MSSITLRFLAEPSTVNFGGKVHGGTVMKWIDEAGYACATSWAKRYCITVYVGGIRFHRPIMIGDLVEVEARLAYTGNTSMNIAVEVRSGEQVYRRLTNGNGEFHFAGLKPGTWTVKLDPAGLPENATIEETSFTVEAKPSAEETLEFKVEQKIRTMRMLAPLKVAG